MSCCGDNYLVPGANPNTGGGGGSVNSVNAGTNITITGPAEDPIVNSSAGTLARPTYTIFVSPNGNDGTATGSLSFPYLTIQEAINFRNTLSADDTIEIFLFAGLYKETITITLSSNFTCYSATPVLINSTPAVQGNSPVAIEGNITITSTNSKISFNNIKISPDVIISSTSQGTSVLNFKNCYINGFIQTDTATSGVSVYFDECVIENSGGSSILLTNGVNVSIRRCQIYHSSNDFPTILVKQSTSNLFTGGFQMTYSLLRNSANSATAEPQIRFDNANFPKGPLEFPGLLLYNTFEWMFFTVDTGGNKCCIQITDNGGAYFENASFNQFLCEGATTGGATPYVIQRGNGGLAFTVLGANYGGPTAKYIQTFLNSVNQQLAIVPNIV